MTQDEIIEMAQECALIGMRPHLDGIYSEALVTFAKLVAEKALAEHAMREVQRLGQEIEPDDIASILACRDMLDAQPVPEIDRVIWPEHTEQEPVAWPCHIIEADFSERTITLGMECGDYKVSAGTHYLSTTPPKETT